MTEDRERFVARRAERWRRTEALVAATRLSAAEWSEFASLYRDLSADVARARSLDVAEDITAYLDSLAGRAHNRLYDARSSAGRTLVHDLFIGFPRTFRAQWRWMALAHLLFYGPLLIGLLGPLWDEGFAASIVGSEALVAAEVSYADAPDRTAGEDAQMAGFYVWNNVGIAFRCFATGALFGLGSIFYLVYNGLAIGAVMGHLWRVGLGWNLFSFVIGHSPWELTGITIAGGAGLRLGWALIDTGGRTRIGSLRAAAPDLLRLVLGAAALLLVAAAIEGFWSAAPAPIFVKATLGVWGATAIVAWLVAVGRR